MDVEGGGEVSEYDRKCSQRFRAFPNNLKMIRFSVMAGQKRVFALNVPAIHVFLAATLVKTWMPGTSPGHDEFHRNCRFYWLHFESDSQEATARASVAFGEPNFCRSVGLWIFPVALRGRASTNFIARGRLKRARLASQCA